MDLFELVGKITIDNADANKQLDDTSKKGKDSESKLGKAFGAVGKGAAVAGKAIAAGMAVGATAVGALVTKSVQAYADYEQLVGGVETLFGTGGQSFEDYAASVGQSVDSIKKFQKEAGIAVDGIIGPETMAAMQKRYDSLQAAQDKVAKNAAVAYRTAGMSANEYMETVTGFSASLISSLGGDTEKAAALADQAIIDMSDNANKMGTDIASIQNAYQGFAKQNYTMLDNLKLGYGGTKEEMQRLLSDAEKLTGKKFDISNFADITEAIHAIQTEMGITGTTANEASTTISGSISSMKASWENLLVAISADDMPFDQYVDDFTTSVATVADNLIPRIGTALDGVVSLVDKLAPVIIEKLPGLFEQLLPSVIEAATGLVNSLVEAAPGILEALMDSLPALIDGVTSIFNELVIALPEIFQVIIEALPTLITLLVEDLPTLIPALIDGLVSMLVTLCENITDIIQPIIDILPEIITSVCNALIENAPELIAGLLTLAGELAVAIPEVCKGVLDALDDVLTGLVDSLLTWAEPIIANIATWWDGVKTDLIAKWEEIKTSVSTAVTEMWTNITTTFSNLWSDISGTVTDIWDTVTTKFTNIKTSVTDTVSGLWTSVTGVFTNLWSDAQTTWSNIKDSIGGAIGGAKDLVDSAISTIKGLFNFEFKWPKLPMPHFSVSGTMNPLKWIDEGVPKIGVEWYAKGGIMKQPTLFDYNPVTGAARVGGEAGDEAVAPIDTLQQYIRAAVQAENTKMVETLNHIVDMLAQFFPDALEAMRTPMVLDPDGAAIAMAPAMNAQLGKIAFQKSRGR